MADFWEVLPFLAWPFVACVVIAGSHCYLGMHVVMRGVIFVDLALAQIAALGATVATLFGITPDSHPYQSYAFSLGFTFAGAGVFAIGRFRDRKIPQEAIIGIVYAVSAAVAILALSKSAEGGDEIKNMLVGQLLFVDWPEIRKTIIIYMAVAALHVAFRRQFFAVSTDVEAARSSGLNIKIWDLVFYITVGIVVTSSVKIAGVLLVFSFLVVPAVCAMMFFEPIAARLLAGWGFGLIASVGGMVMSTIGDFPTGASVVAVFGVLLLICSVIYAVLHTFASGARRALPKDSANHVEGRESRPPDSRIG